MPVRKRGKDRIGFKIEGGTVDEGVGKQAKNHREVKQDHEDD